MTQRRERSDYNADIAAARKRAQYFIDRGTDAQGRRILSSGAYMDAAIRNARSRAS